MSFIVKRFLLKMQVRKDVIFFNYVLVFNLFRFDAWILISNKESDENVWFGYDIQNTRGFHLGVDWVSKVMHVTSLSFFIWLLSTWKINEFKK